MFNFSLGRTTLSNDGLNKWYMIIQFGRRFFWEACDKSPSVSGRAIWGLDQMLRTNRLSKKKTDSALNTAEKVDRIEELDAVSGTHHLLSLFLNL